MCSLHERLPAAVAGLGGGAAEDEPEGGEGEGPQLWMPMEASAMPHWRGVDWLRFYFYKCARVQSALESAGRASFSASSI